MSTTAATGPRRHARANWGRHFAWLPRLCAALSLVCWSRSAEATEDEWWARDKALHFLASASIASTTYAVGTLQWESRQPTIGLALGVAIAAGAGKEGWDAMDHGDASWKDFAWDVIGAVAGVGLSFAVDTAVRPAR